MAARHAKFAALFPTARAIPEALQIGRRDVIDGLEAVAIAGTSTLLLEERRIGKSSVATAVIDRIKADPDKAALGLVVDLKYGARDSDTLARQLLGQAETQCARGRVALLHHKGKLSRAGQEVRGLILEAANLFGAEDEAGVAMKVAEALEASGQGIGDVLAALDAFGRLHDREVVVFIDEVQELAGWKDSEVVQRVFAGAETVPGCRVSFIFAGSEASAIDALFQPGSELDFVGQRLALPAIPLVEWQRGLHPRFAEAGLLVTDEHIAQIYLASDGHPLKTMSICAQVLVVVPGDEVTRAVVNQAIGAAQDHPSWRE